MGFVLRLYTPSQLNFNGGNVARQPGIQILLGAFLFKKDLEHTLTQTVSFDLGHEIEVSHHELRRLA